MGEETGELANSLICVDCGKPNATDETPCHNCGKERYLDPSQYQRRISGTTSGGPFQDSRPYLFWLTIITLAIPGAAWFVGITPETMEFWLLTGWPWIPVMWFCMWVSDAVFRLLRQ